LTLLAFDDIIDIAVPRFKARTTHRHHSYIGGNRQILCHFALEGNTLQKTGFDLIALLNIHVSINHADRLSDTASYLED
jgi:hypothetical protein